MPAKAPSNPRKTSRLIAWWLLGSAAVFAALVSSCDRSKPASVASRWSGDPTVDERHGYTWATEFARRHTGVDWGSPEVGVYSLPKPGPNPSVPPGLKDLSDHGQSAYIEALAKHRAKPGVVRNELGKPIVESLQQDVHEGHDPYRFDRVLVSSVMRGADMLPGDRLLWTRTMVKPVNFQFAGYTVAKTKNSTVKIATVEQDRSHTLSGKLKASIPEPGSPKLDVSAGSESDDKVTGDLTSQFEDVGIDITPEFLRIYRESERGSDISGNTQVELSMITDPKTIHFGDDPKKPNCPAGNGDDLVLVVASAHLTDGQHLLPTDEASLDVRPQRSLPHCPLLARVWTIYEERKILSGGGSYNEGDQKVSLIRNVTYPPSSGGAGHQHCDSPAAAAERGRNCEPGVVIPIVPADDVSPAVWYIKTEEGAAVKADSGTGSPRRLVFTDYTVASDVIHWIKNWGDPTTIGRLQLVFEPGLLVPEKCIEDGCSEGAATQPGTPRRSLPRTLFSGILLNVHGWSRRLDPAPFPSAPILRHAHSDWSGGHDEKRD
jgi:hypothetical protein